jgi:ABC-2 type transport system permease protein
MIKASFFSFKRLWAMIIKEFIQMRRDKVTLAMILGIPIIQLILFGFAINTNPKHLPTALVIQDNTPQTRSFVKALENTSYFKIITKDASVNEANNMLAEGDISFIVQIPSDFTRDLIRNKQPSLLVIADAADPSGTGSAIDALNIVAKNVFDNSASYNGLSYLKSKPSSVNVVIHAKYNPERITRLNIVPGLIGVILTMTMVMVTSLSITKERERGTMESLLATPVRPLEVIIGKIIPYVIVGYVQMFLILIAALFIFNVPVNGSVLLLSLATMPFIAANLVVGIFFSTVAKNQLQAVQMTMFFFLPSILLSGFMFPFFGMPEWAQWLGEVLPLTHFLRIVRGIMLKGNGLMLLGPQLWPLLIFILVVGAIALKRYRNTL